jgi:hypothetical protein
VRELVTAFNSKSTEPYAETKNKAKTKAPGLVLVLRKAVTSSRTPRPFVIASECLLFDLSRKTLLRQGFLFSQATRSVHGVRELVTAFNSKSTEPYAETKTKAKT